MNSKKIELEGAAVEIRPDGIVHIIFKEGVLINHHFQNKLKMEYETIGVTQVRKIIIGAEDFITTEKLFWAFCKKSERFAKGQMTAVVAPTLAQKILARNYLYKYKPENPFMIFNDLDKAIDWLTNSNNQISS